MKSAAFNSTLQSSIPTPYSIFFCVMVLFALNTRASTVWDLTFGGSKSSSNERGFFVPKSFSEKCPAFEKRSHPSTLMMTRTSYLWCKKAEGIMLPSQTRGGTVCWNEFFVDFSRETKLFRGSKVSSIFPPFWYFRNTPANPMTISLLQRFLPMQKPLLNFCCCILFPKKCPRKTHFNTQCGGRKRRRRHYCDDYYVVVMPKRSMS